MSGTLLKRILIVVLPLALLGWLIVWRFDQKKAQEAKAFGGPPGAQARGGPGGSGPAGGGGGAPGGSGGGRRAPSNVEVAAAGPKEIVRTLEVVGTVESPYNVRLSPKTGGRIDYLEVREGTPVKAGEVLVRLDPTEIEGQVVQQQAAVAEAQSRLAQAQITQAPTNVGIATTILQQKANLASVQADYDQVRENYAAQVAAAQAAVTDAQAKVDAAEAQVANAKANLASAQANLENAKVRYDRVNSLYKQGFIAAQDVDDARTTMNVQAAAVKVAQGQVDAASSASRSAVAVKNAASNNAKIVERKGQADIAAAKARVDQARAQVTAANANQAQAPAYEANLAALRSSVAAAQAQLRQAEARRADTALRSPIDGIVTARAADPGSIASPGTAVLTIQSMKSLYVTSAVPVEQSAKVTVGTMVSFTLDALPGRTFNAPVAEVNPSADPQNRQFMIRLKIDNSDQKLRPGMYARLNIVLERERAAVAVPREAVKTASDGTKNVVVVDEKNVAHQVKVETGSEDPKTIEIVKGLADGERVVTLSYMPVRDGQQVSLGRPEGGGQGNRGNRGAGQ